MDIYKVVISQPMFFPWVGLFEQMYFSDVYVHFNHVQMPMGRSFLSRVQIKGPNGFFWWTMPVEKEKKLIKDIRIVADDRWYKKSIMMIKDIFIKMPHGPDVVDCVGDVLDKKFTYLHDFNIYALEKIGHYLELDIHTAMDYPTDIHDPSLRIMDIVKHHGGTVYITGLGAFNYLDHDLLENNGIHVRYMDYRHTPYKQNVADNQPFNPHVSILHLMADRGRNAKNIFSSTITPWQNKIK